MKRLTDHQTTSKSNTIGRALRPLRGAAASSKFSDHVLPAGAADRFPRADPGAPFVHPAVKAEARARRKARVREDVLTTLMVLAFLALVWFAMHGPSVTVWRGR